MEFENIPLADGDRNQVAYYYHVAQPIESTDPDLKNQNTTVEELVIAAKSLENAPELKLKKTNILSASSRSETLPSAIKTSPKPKATLKPISTLSPRLDKGKEKDEDEPIGPEVKRRRLENSASSNGHPLEVPELLEVILQYLPGRDIIFSAEVNRLFRSVVRTRLQYTAMLDIFREDMVYSYGETIIRNIYRNYIGRDIDVDCVIEGIVADINAQELAVSLMKDYRDEITETDIQRMLEQLIKELHQEISVLPSKGRFCLGELLTNIDFDDLDRMDANDQLIITDLIDLFCNCATYKGELKRFKNLLSYILRSENVNVPDEDNRLPLMIVCESGSIEIIEFVLSIQGIDVNIVNKDIETALHLAAMNGNAAIIELLLNRGIEINRSNNMHRTALHIAALYDNLEAVQLLVDRGVEVDATDQDGETALHIAAATNTADMVEALLRGNADIDAPGNEGRTALHEAVRGNDSEMLRKVIRVLLNHNADVTIEDDLEYTALDWAEETGNKEMYLTLLEENNKNK